MSQSYLNQKYFLITSRVDGNRNVVLDELFECNTCGMCNLHVLGDEYHFFFECVKPDIVTLGQQCIPRYYLRSTNIEIQ